MKTYKLILLTLLTLASIYGAFMCLEMNLLYPNKSLFYLIMMCVCIVVSIATSIPLVLMLARKE